MKKYLVLMLAAILVLAAMVGCAQQAEPEPEAPPTVATEAEEAPTTAVAVASAIEATGEPRMVEPREDALDGVIVLGAMPKDAIKWIGKQFAKCLWCDTNFWAAAGCVRRDEKAAGRRTCAQIFESKFSDLIWIGNDEKTSSHFSSAERLAGAEACCKAAGRGLVKMRISEFASQPARNFIGKSLLAESFPIALRLGVLLGRAKIAAGRDLSLACCDDPHETSWAWPELSRAQFDRHRMGRRAAEMMLEMLDTGTTPKSERLASGWIEGATIVKKSGSRK